MVGRFTSALEDRFSLETQRARQALRYALLTLSAIGFALGCSLIIGFNEIFPGLNSAANLRIGSVPSEDIIAREEGAFISEILTEQERQNAVQNVQPVFDPPDPNVARQQRDLTEKILLFIDNVRADSFASLEQQIADVNQITSLILEDDQDAIASMLQSPEERWLQVRSEIISVLERVMRDPIRDIDLQHKRDQLPTQVSLRLSPQESQIVTAIAGDVIRANTFENPEQTAIDRAEAHSSVEPQQRHYIAGQIVAPANQPIDTLSYEALQELGLLAQTSNRGSRIFRAILASALVTVMMALYISRFEKQMLGPQRKTTFLMAVLFLIALSAARALGPSTIYWLPTAALGTLYAALSRPNLAIVASIGFAFLAGLLGRSPSLELASLIAAGNISAILTLRNATRLNSYFLPGLTVGLTNMAIVAIFALLIGHQAIDLNILLLAFVNGILFVPAISFAATYGLTVLFNLPTPFKLMDLSQPSKPLLQRLLREAPGTYQHSLQVANLAEQAAESIGADTQLTHVAALYHDVGKMSNPYFFTENQQHMRNPHDSLNEPYRSADIIIDHVIEGDQIAKAYKLPKRIRDFIREHHGTTQVYVFYQRAREAANDHSDVDPADFSYPGPVPQSRETAILMLADSCESAIRAVHPESSKEITALVNKIFEDKRKAGQLDDSNLTLNDLHKIRETFIDVFKGLFHTRIDYARAIAPAEPSPAPIPKEEPASSPVNTAQDRTANPKAEAAKTPSNANSNTAVSPSMTEKTPSNKTARHSPAESMLPAIVDDEEPLQDVPPLPKRNGTKSSQESRAPNPASKAQAKT